MAHKQELSTEQVFGASGRKTNSADALVGPLSQITGVNAGLTEGLPSIEDRVVNALGTEGKKRNKRPRYTYNPDEGFLRRGDIFDFIIPAPSLSLDIERAREEGATTFGLGEKVLGQYVHDVRKWIDDTLIGAEHTVERKAREAVSALRSGPVGIYREAREGFVDWEKLKPDVYPWVVVLALEGDPVQKAHEKQERFRQGPVSDTEIGTTVLELENAMRYIVHGGHKTESLLKKWTISKLSNIGWFDKLMDRVGTAQSFLLPHNHRNLKPILAALKLPDLNEAVLSQALRDHNLAMDMQLVNDMYAVMTSDETTPEIQNAKANYTKVIEAYLRDEAHYNYHRRALHPLHIVDRYLEVRDTVEKLEEASPRKLRRTPGGSNRLLMGEQVIEAVKAARLPYTPKEQQAAAEKRIQDEVAQAAGFADADAAAVATISEAAKALVNDSTDSAGN